MSQIQKNAPAVIAFVGRSNSGKTTLIEKLLPEITRRGYRVGTLKHTHHDIDLGDPKKDSNRHKNAGATMVVVASPSIVSMVKSWHNPSFRDLLDQFADMDLVIIEGYKSENLPKIEVHHGTTNKERLNLPVKEIIAVVSDHPDPRAVPQFGLDDISALAEFIETRFLRTDPQPLSLKEAQI